MKNLIFFFTFFTCFDVYAQSISVEAQQTEVDPTCCMTLLDDIGTKITVSNLTNSTLEIKVSRQVISSTQGTINYFCWTACYGSQTSVSPQSKSLGPQQVDNNSFEVHFDNLEIEPANASIRYCAFVESNPSDSSCTIVNYTVGTISAIDDYNATSFSDLHPNPTSHTAFLDYSLNSSDIAEIVVTDMLGNVVINKNVINQCGTLKFDVSDTNTGLYFANIFVNGDLKTIKRLVVSK